jgi:hypothetical protein
MADLQDKSDNNTGFWNFKAYQESRWFRTLALTLISLGILYVLLHLFTSWKFEQVEYEYVKLDKDQMQEINRIYFDTIAAPSKTTSVSDSSDTAHTNLQSANTSVSQHQNVLKQTHRNNSNYCDDSTKTGRVVCYLWNQFNNKIQPSQLNSISSYLRYASPLEATSFLANERLQIKSYFWLTGPLVYLEIIFWSWFGVICSILFSLGVISKNRTTNPLDPTTYYDSSEIPSQVAKLLYAPACTLVVVLGYNFFNDQNLADISSSKGVLVFSFVGGYYSSRLVAFLDKLKDLLLPVSSTTDMVADPTPLRNVVAQVVFGNGGTDEWSLLEKDMQSLKVVLQEESSTQQAVALNIHQNQWPIFIFDFVKPGNYTVEATWKTKRDDVDITYSDSQTIEMKGTDQYLTLTLSDQPKKE